MHRSTHRYTHLNPPLDLDQLGGEVVKMSALESRSTHHYTHSNPPLDLDQLGGQVVEMSARESRSLRFKSRLSGL